MRISSYYGKILLLLCLMITHHQAKAQWHKWHLGAGAGSMTYYGDLSHKFVNMNLQEWGYHAYLERLLTKNKGIYLRLESVNGYLLGSDRAPGGWINSGYPGNPDFGRSLNFRTEIHDVNASFVFYFGSKNKRERPPFLNAYVRAGIGVGYFDVYGDLKDANGNFYNYWSDLTIRDLPENAPNASDANVISRDKSYETNLRELAIEKSYNRFKWQIPIGIGLKMRLGDVAALVLEAQYTYAMTDYLDNVGDMRTSADITDPRVLFAADPAGFIGDRPRNLDKRSGLNDGYLYLSAGLTFNIRQNKKPPFKNPVFYPKITPPKTVQPATDSLQVTPQDSVDRKAAGLIGSAQKDFFDVQDSLIHADLKTYSTLWDAPDSLKNSMYVDSMAIVKIPGKKDQYMVQYYVAIPMRDSITGDSLESTDTLPLKNTFVYRVDSLNVDSNYLETLPDKQVFSLKDRKARQSVDSIIAASSHHASAYLLPDLEDSSSTAMDSIAYRTAGDSLKTSGDTINDIILQLRTQLDALEEQLNKTKMITSDTAGNRQDSVAAARKVTPYTAAGSDTARNNTGQTIDTIKTRSTSSLQDSVRTSSKVIPKADTIKKKTDTIPGSSSRLVPASDSLVVKSQQTTDSVKVVPPLKDSVQARSGTAALSTDSVKRAAAKTDSISAAQKLIPDQDSIRAKQSSAKDTVRSKTKALTVPADSIRRTSSAKTDSLSSAAAGLRAQQDTITADVKRKTDSVKVIPPLKDTLTAKGKTISSQADTVRKQARTQVDSIVPATQAAARTKEQAVTAKADSSVKATDARVDTRTTQEETNAQADTVKKSTSKVVAAPNLTAVRDDKTRKKDTVRTATTDQAAFSNTLPPADTSSVRKTATARTAAPQPDANQEATQKKIAELEAQLKAMQSAQPATPQSAQQNQTTTQAAPNNNDVAAFNARLDSLNNAITQQRLLNEAARRNSTTPAYQSSESYGSGYSGQNYSTGSGYRSSEGQSYSGTSGTGQPSSTREPNGNLSTNLNLTVEKKSDGFFAKRKQKKEEAKLAASGEKTGEETQATDSLSSDSLSAESLSTDSIGTTTDSVSTDSTLRAENEWLKQQINDIQKGQDSLLNILSSMADKINQPAPAAPVIVEKAPEKDPIDIILQQPSTKVFFAVGKSAVATQYRSSLDKLATQLRTYPDLRVELRGFADPTGNAAANMVLSEKRADAVKSYLVNTHKIDVSRIIVLPVGQENNSQDLGYSRRVEVQLVK